jgi:hypothetical protein
MDLSPLIELQNIDYKIMDLESGIGDLPEQVNSLSEKVNNLEQEIYKINDKIDECKKDKIRIENETKSLYEKLRKYQEQVYSVSTNKEYDAISTEIENTETAIETNETSILELLESEDNLNKQKIEIESNYQKEKAELSDKNHLLEEKKKQSEDRLNALKTERETVTQKISRPILASYERIRKGRNGVALSQIRNYTCGECFATIPAQMVVEVRQMNSIKLCETCGRILISTNSTTNGNTEQN